VHIITTAVVGILLNVMARYTLALSDNICQPLLTGQWFCPVTSVSSSKILTTTLKLK